MDNVMINQWIFMWWLTKRNHIFRPAPAIQTRSIQQSMDVHSLRRSDGISSHQKPRNRSVGESKKNVTKEQIERYEKSL